MDARGGQRRRDQVVQVADPAVAIGRRGAGNAAARAERVAAHDVLIDGRNADRAGASRRSFAGIRRQRDQSDAVAQGHPHGAVGGGAARRAAASEAPVDEAGTTRAVIGGRARTFDVDTDTHARSASRGVLAGVARGAVIAADALTGAVSRDRGAEAVARARVRHRGRARQADVVEDAVGRHPRGR